MTNQRPRIYYPRDTYKYQVMRGKKILYYGITDDLERSAVEHKVRWPDCEVVQVGRKATRKGALEWQTKPEASKFDDISGWKGFLFVMGIVVACIAVIGSVSSLPIYPSWLRGVLLFAVLGAWIVVLLSNKRWLQILFLTACGILVIYTIIGVILGNIDWSYPGGYKGP